MAYYSIMHRTKKERKCYSAGFYTEDLGMLCEMAEREAAEGKYSCVKIVDTDEKWKDVMYFTKAHR